MAPSQTIMVPSASNPNHWYDVALYPDGGASCDCPAGQHGRCCWHVEAARQAAYELVESAWADMLDDASHHAEQWQAEHDAWMAGHDHGDEARSYGLATGGK